MENTVEVQVFISCPGDVAPEKDMVIDICKSVSQTLRENDSPVRFIPLDWRDIVAPMRGRPQEEINIRFSGYDIYIGILWMRFGSPPGATDPITGKPYLSGTEEEFRYAQQKKEEGADIEMYLFNKEPRAITTLAEHEQHGLVLRFQDQVKNLGWVHPIPNKSQSHEFSIKIHSLLNGYTRQLEKKLQMQSKAEYLSAGNTDTTISVFTEVTKFIGTAPKLENAIPRSLMPYNAEDNDIPRYLSFQLSEKLADIVQSHKRVVVLGSAGSGKSTELGNLAHHCGTLESNFVPVYKRLNTYVDETIADFLPQGWQEIPEQNALIILDGLDEIQAQHFHTAVRKLLTFAGNNPKLRIVISCRTNFYEFPDVVPGGTLNEFDLYFINNITVDSLADFVESNYNITPNDFIIAASNNGYLELTRQPFFLKLLLEEFKQKGNLDINRSELIKRFIAERIVFDQAHFQNTTNLRDKKAYIIKLLQDVALTMELMGTNYLPYSELQVIIPSADDLQLIKYSTAFKNTESNTQRWGFEHNNIQEFLAANALIELPVEQIKSTLSIEDSRIKPSWLNTLFFLMSIINDEKRIELIDWILKIEPEVLVKIEPDKVNDTTRYTIFESIFNYYKRQKVWLRSNKFSERELALFAPADKAYDFLTAELQNKENHRTTRLNALTLFNYLPMDAKRLKELKSIILNYIKENSADHHIVNSAAGTLATRNLADRKIIGVLMDQFGNRANQYIRSALYRVIISAGLINEYIDYFIDGLRAEFQTDREEVHLMDEDILLKEALSKANSVESVIKLLNVFKNPFDRHLMDLFEREKVIRNIVIHAISLDSAYPEIEQGVYDIFTEYGRSSEEEIASIFAEYFIKTGKKQATFRKLFFDKELVNFEKGLLMKPFLDHEAIDFVMKEHNDRNITNGQLLEFYNDVLWMKARHGKENEIDYLTQQLKQKTNLLDQQGEQIDYRELRKKREQESFDLLFDLSKFRKAIEDFFATTGKDELSGEELWAENPHYLRNEEDLPESVFYYLTEFTRSKQTVTKNNALQWLKGKDTDHYFFGKIRESLNSHLDLSVSEKQLAKIESWVRNKAKETDIANGLHNHEQDNHQTIKSFMVTLIWDLVKRFNIAIGQQKILDFTLFDEMRTNEDKGIDFSLLEKLSGSEMVLQRVQENLLQGIANDYAWKNNAIYALEHHLVKAFPVILKNLGEQKSGYIRLKVLGYYVEETHDSGGLMTLLKKIGQDELQWKIVDAIKQEPTVQVELIPYLERIVDQEHGPGAQRLRAAKYLTEKNNDKGTGYYLDYLLSHDQPNGDYYHEGTYLRTIRDVKYLPELMQLLLKANRPDFKDDRFNSLDGGVTEALFNIGMQSEDHLKIVTAALNKFIEDHKETIKNVNFYYPMVDRMIYQFYLAESQKLTVKQALKIVKDISFNNSGSN